MKSNVVLIALAVACMLLTSCRKEFELSETSVKMYVDDLYTIESENGTNLVYTSDNPYVATVSESGVVTANFVGKATIHVTASEGEQALKVDVLPLYTTYEEPCLDFTMNWNDVMTMYEDSYLGKNTTTCFFEGEGRYSYGYLFEDDILQAVFVWCQYTSIDKIHQFLGERYYYEGEYDGMQLYTNWIDLVISASEYKGHPNFGYGTFISYVPADFGNMANSRSVAALVDDLTKRLNTEFAE